MKKFAFLLALLASFAALTPTSSEARDYHHHHHGSGYNRRIAYRCRYCGAPVYQERVFVGYSRYHRPIYSWRTIPHHHHHHRR